jgi:hemerythrin-like domain-containing protein
MQVKAAPAGEPKMACMDAPLFPSPTADFDHPIEIVDDCHGRIRRHCSLVRKLAAHVHLKGVDIEARDVASLLLCFFDTAAANHHRDEEDDLFPAIEHFAPSLELNAVRALLFRLRADHRTLEKRWADIRTRLVATAEGREAGLTEDLAERFEDTYLRHIDFEERELLPLARRTLPSSAVAHLGKSMSRRRGSDKKAA